MKRSLFFLLLPLALPVAANDDSNRGFTLDDFNRRINKAASDERYRDTLLRQDGLHTLIPNEEKPDSTVSGASRSTALPETGSANGAEAGGKKMPPRASNPSAPVEPYQPVNRSNNSSPDRSARDSDSGVKQVGQNKPAKPSNSPSGTTATRANTDSVANAKPRTPHKPKPSRNDSQDYYFPSYLEGKENNGSISSIEVTFDEKRTLFGISIGTEIPVRLKRTSTNVQPGYIELEVTADIPGRKKTLPINSTLFARGSVVKGSSRLYLSSVRGVTPDGEEFNISGHISDDFNTAGLTGVIESDGRAVARSLSSGGLALSQALVGELGSDPLATGAGAAANQMIREGSEVSSANLDKPAFIVSAAPQKGILTVEETF